MDNICLSMAPIQGITNYIFRNCFQKYFGNIDIYYAPYLRIDKASLFSESKKRDVFPENNKDINLIPQIMVNNTSDFLQLSSYLYDLGYPSINWNLGCPYPMVTNRKLGAGLLPHPDLIISILEFVLPKIQQTVSIKLRSGLTDHSIVPTLLPRLNDYPLSEIIVHPRFAKQLYKEKADSDLFESLIKKTNHKLCYNGDITSPDNFLEIQKKFPRVSSFMIGRGIISDPFLAQKLKSSEDLTKEKKKKVFIEFHSELYDKTVEKLSDPSTAIIHLKGYWEYFSNLFTNQHKVFKAIKKSTSPTKYQNAINSIFDNEDIN